MVSRRAWIRIASLLSLILILAWFGYDRTAGADASDGGGPPSSQGGGSPVLVEEVQLQRGIETIGAVGSLEPSEEVALRNEVGGRVIEIAFEEGNAVEEGQVLIRLAAEEWEARRNRMRRQEEFLETEVQRRREVLSQSGVTRQELDQVENDLAMVRAEIQEVEAELARRVLRAPFSGVIGLRSISPGAVLDASHEIGRLRRLDPLRLTFSVPGRYASRVEVGQEIVFLVTGSDEVFHARLTARESGLDERSRMLRVRARVDNEEGLLVAGSVARIRLIIDEREEVAMVPTAAVIESAEGSYLWIVEDEKARRVEVKLGQRSAERVEILEGLAEGDEVVVVGHQRLSEGDEVSVEELGDRLESVAPDRARESRRELWTSREQLEDALNGNRDGEGQ